MAILILVYGKEFFKQFLFPGNQDADYPMILNKESFSLPETADLTLRTKANQCFLRRREGCEICASCLQDKDLEQKNHGDWIRLYPDTMYELIFPGKERVTIDFQEKNSISFALKKYRLNQEICIGRGEENQIVVDHGAGLSRVHAMIRKDGRKWEIQNKSVNGLYVNGKFIRKEKELNYGDVMEIPGIRMIFLGEYLAAEYAGKSAEQEVEIPETSENTAYLTVASEGLFRRSPRCMEHMEAEEICLEAPPVLEDNEGTSVFMMIGSLCNMMLPMLIMNLFVIYGMKKEKEHIGIYVYSGLVMILVSALATISWAFIAKNHEKRHNKKKKELEMSLFQKHLNRKNQILHDRYEKTKKILNSRYLDMETYLSAPQNITTLWSRNPSHEDFLKCRMGIGNMPFQIKINIPEESMKYEESGLWMQMKKMKDHYQILYQVPMLLDLKKYSQIGIVGWSEASRNILQNLAGQIAWNHCYTEVKMGFIYNKEQNTHEREWDFCKWLPHVWDGSQKIRLIAEDKETARKVCYQLYQTFKEREERNLTGCLDQDTLLPHYVLFIAEPEYLEGELFSKYLLHHENKYGLTVVWTATHRDRLPNLCRLILENTETFAGWYPVDRRNQEQVCVHFDRVSGHLTEKLARKLSAFRVAEFEENKNIPEKIDFLGMYHVEELSKLDIEERWKKNMIYESAGVIIGEKAGGIPCYLDIHERYHGPHGLIAGTTGSGKSEVLQTYILSLAVNFSPEDVNFLLIDYKGGGMSGLFAGLPHVCGQISNLSESQVNRAMVSVKSENKRRQILFRKHRINHINDYTKRFHRGEEQVPLPHLFIIVDEFAELKKEKPEFMDELISVAQVGRSLGVHLILATQKPGGVVDDKIWSNSRFRICLRVQEKQDSQEMLHNMDACNILQVGRGYLQVGNNEIYEQFQSGWSGAEFFKEKRFDETVQLLNINGEADKEGILDQKKTEGKRQTQLEAVKSYIYHLSQKGKYAKARTLWMEPLPRQLCLSDLKKDSGEEKGRCFAYIGRFDDPEQQSQPAFCIHLLESGHIAVQGRSASGKSVLLQTMIFSLLEENRPEEVQLYLLDFDENQLSVFSPMPHVGEVICGEETEKIRRLFFFLEEELKKRKKKFGGGNLEQYRNAYQEELPMIVVVIDSFTTFCERTEQQYEKELFALLREGEKAGILLVVAAESFLVPGAGGRMGDFFQTKICLSMKDKYAYGDALGMIQVPVFPEKGIAGRGVAFYQKRILEFQTALCIKAANNYERIEKMKKIIRQTASRTKGKKAKRIRTLPQKPGWEAFLRDMQESEIKGDALKKRQDKETDEEKTYGRAKVCIGYDDRTAEIFKLFLDDIYCFLVMGYTERSLNNWMKILISFPQDQETQYYLIDRKENQPDRGISEESHIIQTEETLFHFFEELTPVFAERSHCGQKNVPGCKKYFILIADLSDFLEMIYEGRYEMKGFLENIWEKGGGYQIYFWAMLNLSGRMSVKRYPAFELFSSYQTGMQLGGNLLENEYFSEVCSCEELSYEEKSMRLKENEAWLFEKEEKPVKLIIPEIK